MQISRRKLKKNRCQRAGENQAAGVTVELARAVRLAGVSRPANRLQHQKPKALALKALILLRKMNAMSLHNQ
jgi:hypothetical protein